MSNQLLDWEPMASSHPVQEIKVLSLIAYIDAIYQQYQIDQEQYNQIIRMLNDIKNEEN